MKSQGVKIIKIKSFMKSNESIKYEFSSRETSDYILIKGKKGGVFGEHWHEGKVRSKSPETLLLIKGKVKLSVRYIKTKKTQQKIVKSPSIIQIFPFWYHELIALTDIILLEFGSLKDHKADRKE